MNIGIDGIGFTSLLSNRIVVNTDDGYPIQMVVKMNSIKIYESTLYPLDGKVIFYDLVVIVQYSLISFLFQKERLNLMQRQLLLLWYIPASVLRMRMTWSFFCLISLLLVLATLYHEEKVRCSHSLKKVEWILRDILMFHSCSLMVL